MLYCRLGKLGTICSVPGLALMMQEPEVRGPLSWRMVCLEDANCWPTDPGWLGEVCFGPKEIFVKNLNDC